MGAYHSALALPAVDFVVEVGWRVRLKDGTMVAAATASQRGLEVEAEVKSAAGMMKDYEGGEPDDQ